MQKVNGIYLPAGDTHFPEAIRSNPMYEGKGTYQFKKLMAALQCVTHKRGSVALDVGAHVGLWTRVLAHEFHWVHAFEPLAGHHACLQRNCEGLANVLTYGGFALGDREGLVGLCSVQDNSGNAHVCSPAAEGATVLPVRRIDDLLDDASMVVSFMKIDVEGYELEVVKGAEQLIKRTHPVMVVEQKPGYAERYGFKTYAVIDLLKSWGASIVWVKAGDYCLRWG